MSIFVFASSSSPAPERSARQNEIGSKTLPPPQPAAVEFATTAPATFARRQSALAQRDAASQSARFGYGFEICARARALPRPLPRRARRRETIFLRQSRLSVKHHRSADGRNVA